MRALASLSSPEEQTTSWGGLVPQARSYLQERGKDVRCGVVLCLALFKVNELSGLATGLYGLARLIETYPETMMPARPKGRTNALETLQERLVGWLAGTARPRGRDSEAGRLALAALDRLKAAVALHWPNLVSLNDLSKTMKRFEEAAPNPAAPNPAAPSTPQPPPRHSTPAPAPAPRPAAETAEGSPQVQLLRMGRQLAKLAHHLRDQDPTAPEAYRLLRAGIWLRFAGVPDTDPEGRTRTQIHPDTGMFLRRLKGKHLDALVADVEAAVEDHPTQLELHYIVAEALRAQGEALRPALAAVEAEVAAVVHRLPGLIDLLAEDGKPLASDDARRWIEGLAAQEVIGAPPTVPPSASAALESDADNALQAEAEALEAAGRTPAAVAVLERACLSATSERDRFRWNLGLARLALRQKRNDMAQALLAGLDAKVALHALETWEPRLCAEFLVTALEAARRGSDPQGPLTRAQLYQRLCAVAPSLAFGSKP
jgi:type VI secretion system protein VasJ